MFPVNAAKRRLLIVGLGDVARRALPGLSAAFEVHVATRAQGIDFDRPETLSSIPPVDAVLHSVPPPEGEGDPRTGRLLEALDRRGILPTRWVYISTSGVYGDCAGERVDESRPVRPRSERARRRVAAEMTLSSWCAARGATLVILRAPGIYAGDRLPLARLRAGTPVLRAEEDVYTNHVHADDLAGCCVRGLQEDAPGGIYNASDDTEMKMGDWFDFLADRAALPRPPRIPRSEAPGRIPAPMLSFLEESRRLVNTRMKQVLGYALRYPTVREGVGNVRAAGIHQPA